MNGNGPRNLSADDIKLALSRADQIASLHGEELLATYEDWPPVLEFLASEECPKTYLPVLTVMLVARSLRDKEHLDVLAIQKKASDRGYASASIARELIPFATQAGIDFRTTSTQVMNNQPFTFKERVLPDMAGARVRPAYAKFYKAALRVQQMRSDEAGGLLSLVFFLRRVTTESQPDVIYVDGGRGALLTVVDEMSAFVRGNSEGGKVGQAFAAAVLDLLFPQATVRMGKVNDPSASIPGDVQVGDGQRLWLWSEIKQKPVVTADAQTFLKRVSDAGGDRAWYLALANRPYPHNLDVRKLKRMADNCRTEWSVYQDPMEVLTDVLPKVSGTADDVTAALILRFARRLHESGVSTALQGRWGELADTFC